MQSRIECKRLLKLQAIESCALEWVDDHVPAMSGHHARDRHEAMVTKKIIAEIQLAGARNPRSQPTGVWHGVRLNQPDWSSWSHSVALGAEFVNEGSIVHWILNAYWEPLDFELPAGEGRQWKRWIDTNLDTPEDILPWEDARPFSGTTYRVAPHSVAILYTPVDQRDSRKIGDEDE